MAPQAKAEKGLDAAFLEFLGGPDKEGHRRIHSYYVRYFKGRGRVVDLACGEGVFLRLLVEAGVDAIGVDVDPVCVARVREAGLPVEEADVLEWLARQPHESVDGIFNAHLVEHLDYRQVLELYRQSLRVLRPGGLLVTVTPNVRGLFSHLELFYQHFGHVTFYHPRLLAFFADQAGFKRSEEGENPRMAVPLFGRRRPLGETERRHSLVTAVPLPRYETLLPKPDGLVRGLWWRAKMVLASLIVRPYLDPLVADLHAALAAANADRIRLANAIAALDARAGQTAALLESVLDRLDRSFEAYVVSYKAGGGSRAASGTAAGAARAGGSRRP